MRGLLDGQGSSVVVVLAAGEAGWIPRTRSLSLHEADARTSFELRVCIILDA